MALRARESRRLRSPGRETPAEAGPGTVGAYAIRPPVPCPAALTAGSPTGVPSGEAVSGVERPACRPFPYLPILAMGGLLALAAVLRLLNLATNPGWDGDEGYNYNIALNLAQGRHQMFALDFAFVQHPPLYFALAAALFHLLGASMLTLRLLSISFCLGTLALLPALGEAMAEPGGVETAARRPRRAAFAGWLAAVAYTLWPFAALQQRFGYTYNGLAFWTALCLLGLLRYRRHPGRGSLILAALACAAALATDQEALYLLPILLLGLKGASPWRRLGALALALSGPAAYLGAMFLSDRATLLFDITHTAGRVSGGPLSFQLAMWFYNLADLIRIDPLIALGLTGLALIPARSTRHLVLALLAAMLLIILKIRDPNPLFRTAEPLIPLVCLGLGVTGARILHWLERIGRSGRQPDGTGSRQPARWVLLALLVGLGGVALSRDVRSALTRFATPIDGLLPRSTADAAALARWINRRAGPDDLVLAMPQVSWQFRARTAELLQAVAITGRGTAFYPDGLATCRWTYDVHLAAARYLVVDGFTRAWIAQSPGERALVQQAQRTWPLVYSRGEYRVYQNPRPEEALARIIHGGCRGGAAQPGGGLRADAAGILAGKRGPAWCSALRVNNAGYVNAGKFMHGSVCLGPPASLPASGGRQGCRRSQEVAAAARAHTCIDIGVMA